NRNDAPVIEREQAIINHLFEILSPQKIVETTNKYYPYSDLNEFISEALTSTETINALAKSPSFLKRVKNAIVKLVRSLLGYTDSMEQTLFDDAVNVIFEYLTPE